jgi:hypothetical protein
VFADRKRRAAAAKRVVDAADEFRWSRVVEPLVRFCREPRWAADRRNPAPIEVEIAAEPPRPLHRRVVERYRADGVAGVAAAMGRTARRAAERFR